MALVTLAYQDNLVPSFSKALTYSEYVPFISTLKVVADLYCKHCFKLDKRDLSIWGKTYQYHLAHKDEFRNIALIPFLGNGILLSYDVYEYFQGVKGAYHPVIKENRDTESISCNLKTSIDLLKKGSNQEKDKILGALKKGAKRGDEKAFKLLASSIYTLDLPHREDLLQWLVKQAKKPYSSLYPKVWQLFPRLASKDRFKFKILSLCVTMLKDPHLPKKVVSLIMKQYTYKVVLIPEHKAFFADTLSQFATLEGPNQAKIMYGLGRFLLEQKERKSAIFWLEKGALKNHPSSILHLVSLYCDEGRFEEAGYYLTKIYFVTLSIKKQQQYRILSGKIARFNARKNQPLTKQQEKQILAEVIGAFSTKLEMKKNWHRWMQAFHPDKVVQKRLGEDKTVTCSEQESLNALFTHLHPIYKNLLED